MLTRCRGGLSTALNPAAGHGPCRKGQSHEVGGGIEQSKELTRRGKARRGGAGQGWAAQDKARKLNENLHGKFEIDFSLFAIQAL